MLDDDRERFLDFDGWRFWLTNVWSVRFRVKVAKITKERPAGIKYSLTMHDSNGNRVLGYDNAERKRKRIKWLQRRTATTIIIHSVELKTMSRMILLISISFKWTS